MSGRRRRSRAEPGRPAAGPGRTDDPGIAELLSRCTFPGGGSTLVCGVSGGPDSLALLVLAVAAGCSVTALHVDHALREGSAAEADVVADAARRFGAAFVSEQVVVEPGPNLEARARLARFGVLGPDAATGHTADDQAETVLLNLLRGAGVSGLSGMRPGFRHPLLGLRRFETEALCRRLGLRVVDDPSNRDRRFVRNRIRHELLPLCSDVAGRDVVPVLARQARVLASDADLLHVVASLVDPTDAAALAEAPEAASRRAIRQWLSATGPHPPSLAAVDRVLDVARRRYRSTELPGGVRVDRSRGRLERSGPVAAPSGRRSPEARFSGSDTVVPVTTTGEHEGAVARSGSTFGPGVGDLPMPELQPGPDELLGVGEVVVSSEDLEQRILELGKRISADYVDSPPLLVGVLKGAFVFMSDLCRTISLPVDVDFMAVSSYGSATRTSGVVRIVKDLDVDLTGRHVLVVEDIVDSGLTLSYLQRYLLARDPASLEVCALLVKDGQQRTDLDLRYVGFHIPPDFVVGYGLDVEERLRNLRAVHVYTGDPR
ncbi:MAG: hypoxanthine phosphoribosyltransferase [Acidimicrobiales bacterium]